MQTENSPAAVPPPSVVDRYYTRHTVEFTSETGKNNDVCVLKHSNELCVVTLSQNHCILQEHKTVKKVDFSVSDGVNRLDNHVSGKFKRGAQWLKAKSQLCRVVCEDGEEFTICSGAAGKLVEVNERLVETPQLLTAKPETEGYIAIIMADLPAKRGRSGHRQRERN